MGLGSYPAGSTLGGVDVNPFSAEAAAMASAAKWDPLLRVVVLNSDGTVATVHYVDQQVALALGVELGTIPSAPNVGIRLSNIRTATVASFALACRDSTVGALVGLLRSRAIVLGDPLTGIDIVAQYDPAGNSRWAVNYQNLLAPSPRGRTANVALGGR